MQQPYQAARCRKLLLAIPGVHHTVQTFHCGFPLRELPPKHCCRTKQKYMHTQPLMQAGEAASEGGHKQIGCSLLLHCSSHGCWVQRLLESPDKGALQAPFLAARSQCNGIAATAAGSAAHLRQVLWQKLIWVQHLQLLPETVSFSSKLHDRGTQTCATAHKKRRNHIVRMLCMHVAPWSSLCSMLAARHVTFMQCELRL